ncbi:MAG: hypothetical protein JWQ09_2794, partial [Segetibacter sp.]|nr:hypothetical protein [Segetibacter sp.]
ILGEKRKINIKTPSGANKYDAYPVLYLLDCEVQTALVAGQVQNLSDGYKIIPKLIVVSIENTDRTRDLTPTHSIIGPNGNPDTSANAMGKTSGGGEKFLQFLKEELMPYIESNYPTASYKILSGHSLGGLMAVYCLVNHPSYFDAYIGISPSLQWDKEMMLEQAAKKLDSKNVMNKILFFSDANEDAAFHQNQLKLDSLLKLKNIAGLKYKRMFYPEETHISEPVKAFYDGIRFIYPDWHLPYNSSAFKKTMSSKVIIDHYKQLSQVYGYNVVPLHDEIIQISRFLRNDPNRMKDAIELLQMNAVNYPASPIVHETLGDTYVKAGDTINALISFQKALQLDPSNKTVPQKIKDIQHQ